ncbi:AAA family ATPase [Enterococcus casseliflavus]|mgnify:FL=1|uniref:NB-ARC domain-containing protein n=1 Tax=Enterococcus casseliflavus TaxID=37734 RepID=UPI001432DA63|nr:NB-ARC domain-containing protein [Enterococcus casseliflavus]NKD39336.1 AAA family ATPase [Enterococcus casseliflavus]
MTKFNLNNRILMFSICSSIEFDLRKFLVNHSEDIELPTAMYEKAVNRNKNLVKVKNSSSEEEILVELDMGDLVSVISRGAPIFKVSSSEKKDLHDIFDKVIPIRNKVMHTRPIEFSDRGTLEETLHTIDDKLKFIEWSELKRTRDNLKNNPQKLIVETTFIPELDNTTDIYHNLPVPEFDDTGYIGRRKEINELLALIESDKDQIITVVGNGGIGKTAITVKCLYELLDGSNNFGYDAIIWVSLKTKTLSKGEFININSSITEISSMYSSLYENMIEETGDIEEDILTFMNEFSTLLVIDNLETLPTEEIINFLKRIPSKSKVLLTSRSGLGELENRYSLREMNKTDARNYFISLSIYYQLDLHKKPVEDLDNLIEKHLYSSPLSIKWYITSIYFGADPTTILSNKDDLVEFSMSNIIENLSLTEIEILWLLLVEGKPLSYGEIDYYIAPKHSHLLISSVNKLSTTSMLKTSSGGNYDINNMAKDYLKTYRVPSSDFIREVSQKRLTLNRMLQEIKIKNEADPYNPKSLFSNLRNENTKIASYYLIKSLEHSSKREWILAEEMIKKAENVAPDYFEVYKIKAFINAESGNLMDAITSYRIAIENAHDDIEKASVCYLFSVFYTLKIQDYIKARELIEEAQKYAGKEPRITLERGRVFMYLGEFEEALEIFESIDRKTLKTDKLINQYASKISELYRRMAENYDNRDFKLKYTYLEKSIEEIVKIQHIDQFTCAILVRTLIDLTYMFSYKPALDLFIMIFESNKSIIQNNSSGYVKRLRSRIEYNETLLPENVVKSGLSLGLSFSDSAKSIVNKNEGIITKITDSFGFIRNSYGDYYFQVFDIKYQNPVLGDRVTFEIKKAYKGFRATQIKSVD